MGNNNQEQMTDELPGQPESYWLSSTEKTNYGKLSTELSVDVAVIGGGIAGLTTAYFLNEKDLKVAILEGGRIVERVTGNTTAKVTSQHGLIYDFLIKHFGFDKAKLYAESNQEAIEKIFEIVNKLNIDCDLSRQDAYVYAETEDELVQIKKEVEAAKSLDLPASFVGDLNLRFETKGAIKFSNQAQFHPRKYLLKVAEFLQSKGCLLFENTRVTDIEEGEPCILKTENGDLKAKNVVIATNFPIKDLKGLFSSRMTPKRSYVLGIRINGDVPNGVFYKDGTPYFSFRSQPTDEGPLLIVGGENHKPGEVEDAKERYKRLEELARSRFDVKSVDYRWSTQDYITEDKVPFIGEMPNSKHLYVETGFRGWGMTNSTVAALIVSDLIAGVENKYASLYSPSRFKPLTSAKSVLSEGIDDFKHFVGDRLKKGEKISVDEIKNEEGKIIVNSHGKKVAVYKDKNGKIYAVSPVCTHLKCIVHFNNAEKTWDCPCHGSRFNYDGKVLRGPATKDLEKKEI